MDILGTDITDKLFYLSLADISRSLTGCIRNAKVFFIYTKIHFMYFWQTNSPQYVFVSKIVITVHHIKVIFNKLLYLECTEGSELFKLICWISTKEVNVVSWQYFFLWEMNSGDRILALHAPTLVWLPEPHVQIHQEWPLSTGPTINLESLTLTHKHTHTRKL